MSVLSAQSIKRLCVDTYLFPDGIWRPLISPFVSEKVVHRGTSYGLSACSYDLRIAHDLTLRPGSMELGHSIECFALPPNVMGCLYDKSTYARRGVSAFNTLFDPGFIGYGTLELANFSKSVVELLAGDPICQMVFQWLDEPSDRPYAGKFQDQPARVVGPRLERPDGSYDEGVTS